MNNSYTVSKKDKFNYCLFFLGQCVLWSFVGYIATLMTDLGINPSLAAKVILIPKIWDAVNDTLFGFLIDKCNFKKGKYMPWIRIGVSIISVTVIFMFFIPKGFSETLKCAWVVIGYILFDACYTLLDAPAFAMPNAMTTDVNERTSLISIGKLGGVLGTIVAVALVALIQKRLGWAYSSILFSLVGVGLMIPFSFSGKEIVNVQNEVAETFSIKAMFSYLKSNNMLLVVLISLFICGITSIDASMSLYVSRCCLGNQDLGTIISLCTAIPVMIISTLLPSVAKKIDKFYILIFGLILGFVSNLFAYFIGYSNLVLSIIVIALKFSGMAFYNIILYMLIADTVEYGKYRTGIQAAGIAFSLQTFVSKLKGALITSILLAALSVIGYNSSVEVQTALVNDGIWNLFTLIPMLGYLISTIILLVFYKLRDTDVQTIAKFNNKEIKEEDLSAKLIEKIGEPLSKQYLDK